MRISTEIASIARHVGEHKAVELVAKAGFDCWDFSMFDMCRVNGEMIPQISDHPLSGTQYLRFARELKQIGLDNGITCNQSHAPFPVISKEIRSYCYRAIECTAEAGGQICVIHPWNNWSPEENAQMYHSMLPFARACGIKIATENMWNWDPKTDQALPAACSDEQSFLANLQAVDDESFVACLDIGHAEMRGLHTTAEKMILALGDKLQALHLHDNDRHYDSHQLPFTMDIDFEAVVRSLKKIGYTGDLTLEADRFLQTYTADTVAQGVEEMAKCANRIRDMF